MNIGDWVEKMDWEGDHTGKFGVIKGVTHYGNDDFYIVSFTDGKRDELREFILRKLTKLERALR